MKKKYEINATGKAFISVPKRGPDGRIQTDYFELLILIVALVDGHYSSSGFKAHVKSLGILKPEDRHLENDGKRKWTHRIDAAKQHLVIDALLEGPPHGVFRIPSDKEAAA